MQEHSPFSNSVGSEKLNFFPFWYAPEREKLLIFAGMRGLWGLDHEAKLHSRFVHICQNQLEFCKFWCKITLDHNWRIFKKKLGGHLVLQKLVGHLQIRGWSETPKTLWWKNTSYYTDQRKLYHLKWIKIFPFFRII